MTDTPLLDWTPPTPEGETFDKDRDGPRLAAQARRVFDLMRDGQWRTLGTISALTLAPEASCSARLRDLRKVGYTVDRDSLGRGLYQYRVTGNKFEGG